MKTVVYGEDGILVPWAQRIIGVTFRADAVAIGLVRDTDTGPLGPDRDSQGRRILAVCVFDGFSPYDCNMHIASDQTGRWLNREFILRCFAYPFTQCNLRRVTGLVPSKNTAARKFDEHLGFRLEGRCRDALPDDDLLIYGMTRAECRYIPQEARHV